MSERISLLHLTDLHFESSTKAFAIKDQIQKTYRCSKSSYDLEDATMLANWAWVNRVQYDAILFTGDMAETGHIDDLNTALKYFDSNVSDNERPWLLADDFPTIINSSKNIFVLPGNHDRFHHPNRYPNNKKFDEVFSDYWPYGKYIKGGMSTFTVDDNNAVGLSIVLADFSLEKREHGEEGLKTAITRRKFGYYGQGKAYDYRVKKLVEATEKIKDEFPNYPVIWAIHFEPLNNKSTMQLLDESTFIDAVRDNNIACVLNGHTHKEKTQIIDGTLCTSITSPSPFASSLQHKNGFSIIDFYVDGNEIVEVKVNPFIFKGVEIEPWNFVR